MSMMQRVTKRNPCPICSKFDWCLIGKSLVICMRVQSPRDKVFKDGSQGWIHLLDGAPSFIQPRKSEAKKDAAPNLLNMLVFWGKNTNDRDYKSYADQLGVSVPSLRALGAVIRTPSSWAFPMKDDKDYVVGIRIRCNDGKKFAVKGGHQGLFIPAMEKQDTVYLPEGPTNTAACLTLGLFAIGRPNAGACVQMVCDAIRRLGCKRAVIVADTDTDRRFEDGRDLPNPGTTGAIALSEHLKIPNCTLLLPTKDMRKFVQSGGTVDVINYMLKQTIWKRP